MEKETYIYKSSIVYPYVNFETEEERFSIRNTKLCKVIACVEEHAVSNV